MLKVRVRFDNSDVTKTIKLNGFIKQLPVLNQDFSMYMIVNNRKVQVDFGKLINFQLYADMYLIQTEKLVAEVWIVKEEKGAEVLPLKRKPSLMVLNGGKVKAFRGASRASTNKLSNKGQLKALGTNSTTRPHLRLVKE